MGLVDRGRGGRGAARGARGGRRRGGGDRRRLRRRRARAEPAAAARATLVAAARGARACAAACSTPRSRTAAGCSSGSTREALAALVAEAHAAGLEIALAGALRAEDLPAVRATGADIAGVRSAACRDGRRTAALDPARIARLRDGLRRRAGRGLRGCTRVPAVRPRVEQLGEPRGLAAVDHPRLDAGRPQRAGRWASTPSGRSAASSSTVSSARRGEVRDRLDQHEPPRARGARDPRGDRVRA